MYDEWVSRGRYPLVSSGRVRPLLDSKKNLEKGLCSWLLRIFHQRGLRIRWMSCKNSCMRATCQWSSGPNSNPSICWNSPQWKSVSKHTWVPSLKIICDTRILYMYIYTCIYKSIYDAAVVYIYIRRNSSVTLASLYVRMFQAMRECEQIQNDSGKTIWGNNLWLPNHCTGWRNS